MLLVLYGTLNLWLRKPALSTAETRLKVCELLLCQPANNDSPGAVDEPPDQPLRQAQAALLLDPASAYRWTDLAESEINARNVEGAKFSMRQALAAAPGNPAVLFRAATFYLRIEDYPETLQQMVAVLRNPELAGYYDRVFALYSQMDLPLKDLLNQGVPHSPGAANAFLRFWINQNKLEEAQETFNWINQNSLASLKSAGSYTALLAKDGRWDEAMESWSQDTAKLDAEYGKTNWVYNGSFEMQPVECPFDWQFLTEEAVKTDIDGESGYKGNSSLRVKFLDTPKDSSPVAVQTVILKPGIWELKAAMKTQQLTGDQGVVIRVVDGVDNARLDVATNTFSHTQEWTTVSKTFQAGETKLARVEIMRPPSRDTGIRVTGTVWVDAVSLTPVQ